MFIKDVPPLIVKEFDLVTSYRFGTPEHTDSSVSPISLLVNSEFGFTIARTSNIGSL